MEHEDQNGARDAADGDDPGGPAVPGTTERPRRRPGLSKESFRPKTLRADAQAGLVNAVVSVPDGLAAGALAGVNPVYGLYTSATSAIAGGLTSSSHMMMIATTSAASLAAGQAVASYPAEDRGPAVFLISLLTGVFLALFAVLRVGRLVRYVSHSVMTGFLFGVSAVLVLDQLAPLVGYRPDGANELLQFIDLVRHVGDWDLVTTVVGLVALAIMVGLMSTRFETMATVVALVVPSLAVVLLGLPSVERVGDVAAIPSGLPALSLPDLSLLSVDLVLAALALAGIVAIQGAGVSQQVENPDDSRISTTTDIFAQGAGNIAAGIFSGIPAGGSVGQTALNVSAGARSRWASVLSGVWMLLFIVVLPGVVTQVPMTVLGALMVIAGLAAISSREARSIWSAGLQARLTIAATFFATLVLSIPLAVAAGFVLSVLVYVARSGADVRLVELRTTDDGGLEEHTDLPGHVPDGSVLVLAVRGSMFFAGARALQEQLPSARGSRNAVVVLRLRGHEEIGATFIDVLDDYADELEAGGGRLHLTGLSETMARQLRLSAKLDIDETVHLEHATPRLGASTAAAMREARSWLSSRRDEPVEERGHELRRPQAPVLPEGALRVTERSTAHADDEEETGDRGP
ncbi:SulP family inorganic anion transporter [Ornithinimicrobium sp. W1679]|uniref:SulP family inorganic anion transporter n=1 Tax=Ornithinimicrobium sp. W1679 TaxID=3418770 RepID=UPI003CF354F4